MKRGTILLALCVGATTSQSTELSPRVQSVLTTIDSIPSQAQIDFAFGSDHATAAVGLAAIAGDDAADLGIRMRSIHALAKYCDHTPCEATDTAHLTLLHLIQDTSDDSPVPQDKLILRAALETIGTQRILDDVQWIVPHLGSLSRDVRAAAVHGLRDLCNTQAIAPLSQLQSTETSGQVLQAITEALRVLRSDPCR